MKLEADGGKIKPANYPQEYEPWHIMELAKCRKDPIYFIETYCKVVYKGNTVQFKLWPYQKNLIMTYLGHDRIISLLPRQTGKCVGSNTIIYKNGSPVQVKELVNLSLRDRAITWLENVMVSLARWRDVSRGHA